MTSNNLFVKILIGGFGMTKLEFNEVIKVFDLSNIKDIKIEYSNANYSAIVKGYFPSSFVPPYFIILSIYMTL